MQAFWVVYLYQSLPILWSIRSHVIDHFYWVRPLSWIALGTVVLNYVWQTFCKSKKKSVKLVMILIFIKNTFVKQIRNSSKCSFEIFSWTEHIRYRLSHEIVPLRRRPSRVHWSCPNKQLIKLLRTRSLLRTALTVAALILGAAVCWATEMQSIAIKMAIANIDFAILKFSMFNDTWNDNNIKLSTISKTKMAFAIKWIKNSLGNGQWTPTLFLICNRKYLEKIKQNWFIVSSLKLVFSLHVFNQ